MEEDILARLRAREPGAQKELRRAVLPRLVATCARLLSSASCAEELAEDLWNDFLLLHVERLRHASAIHAYLRMMAVTTCRRRNTRAERFADLADAQGAAEASVDPESMLSEAVETRRRQARLAQCLSRLAPRPRALVRMRFSHGLTQEAIGERMGVSKQYVGKVLAKTLDSLRKCMEAQP